MSDAETVNRFSRTINEGLAQGGSAAEVLRAALEAAGDSDAELAERLGESFREAVEPRAFFHQRVLRPDLYFEQCDALLRVSFDPAELEPKDRLVRMIEHLSDPTHTFPFVLQGRFWRVSGPQRYDTTGRLEQFDFDPLVVTESIVSVVAGHYMSMRPVGRRGGIGALGNIVTRERFRGGQGHGAALVQAFEQETARLAESRREKLEIYLLESQVDSQGFWYKQGFRWPRNTKYAQPPLEFDPATGERLHDEVPETLMVKLPGKPDATSVDAGLLTDAVRTMYLGWCLEDARQFPPAAARRAEEYVMGKVLGEFRASLPPRGAPVPLVAPPSLQ
jgi:hypothetical protein